ncbi:MAG: hypothetical protein JRI95_12655 [Deltaproteobacteria bacterium]|nr:hypothetical protein [Deltaproteobacteria bacterium]
MEKDFRYEMRYIGDAFADQVENLCLYVKDFVRGITLTYSINELKKEKEKVISRIGERVVAIRNNEPGQNLISDDTLARLFQKFDIIQGNINASIKERKTRLYPNKT